MAPTPPEPPPPVRIRSFAPADLPACQRLYVEGLIGGHIAEGDPGLDISDIESAYLHSPGSHFWVAQSPQGEPVGMIGVRQTDIGKAEIRRLRVRGDYRRRGVGSALMETALGFCQDQGYLKVTLDTYMDREPAVRLFEKFRFHHSRTKRIGDKDLLYFYLDLYTGGDDRHDADPKHA